MNNKGYHLSRILQPAEVAAALLIFLFTYAALSKLLAFEQFKDQMQLQPFSPGQAGILTFALPPTELLTAVLLLFDRTRQAGLWLSLLLMLCFTSYVSLVLLGFWPNIPCTCGGVLKQLSWNGHFALNVIFLLISAAGLIFNQHGRRCGDTGM